jgi:hypothetical protein
MVFALARYLGQERTSSAELIERIALVAPEAVRRAARFSGLVQRQGSPRWKEVERLAATRETEFGEFVRVFHTFDRAHRERLAEG